MSVEDILRIEDSSEFCLALLRHCADKRYRQRVSLTDLEEMAFLVLNLENDILMEGFVDVFYEQYSLRECPIVEDGLRAFGLPVTADLFAEAFRIYVNGELDISDEAYKAVDPFGDDPRWNRFDEIGDLITAPDSEIRQLPDRLASYIKARPDQLR